MIKSQLQNIQVLIVDDEKLIQRLVYDVLIKLGFRSITIAHSGRQAIDIASQKTFDFIITDWRMKDLDGIGQVLFLLEKWWREAGFGLAEVCLAKSAFS